MIRYDLKCDAGHAFDAWFPSGDSYDDQDRRGLLSCPHCQSPKVSKAIMAPNVAKGNPKGDAPVEARDFSASDGTPAQMRRMMRELRARMTEGAENVGVRFASEARRMHRGEIPERSLYGDASPEQVRELLDEGVPIAPLPPEPGGH